MLLKSLKFVSNCIEMEIGDKMEVLKVEVIRYDKRLVY